MQEVRLVLEPQEAVNIANMVGQIPTQAGVFPLYQKIKSQIEQQLPKAPDPASDSAQTVQ